MALILASGSPRRRELMSLITPDYTVITSDVDETKIAADSPAHLAKALATAKARAVAEGNPDDVVCGFDTVVECEGEVFGKPKDEADAVRMLRALSGREHRVHTGVCICRGRRAAATVETTVVHFSPIAEDDLCAYVRTPEPYDKAGAYANPGARGAVVCGHRRVLLQHHGAAGSPHGAAAARVYLTRTAPETGVCMGKICNFFTCFFGRIHAMFTKDIGIDLGTANTLVYMKGRGIIMREPSVVAVDPRSDELRVRSVGHEAKAVIGRAPGSIVAVRPLKDGVIADFDVTAAMLQSFIRQACGNSILARPRVVICVPSGVTEVERRAVRQAAAKAGARQVTVIEEPMAAAIGSGLPTTDAVGSMIVDIGGGTAEVAVISLSGIVASRSVRCAGDALDQSIIAFIKRKYNLLVGERTAEQIKIEIGSACPQDPETSMEIKGRNLVDGLPKDILIRSEEVRDAMNDCLLRIVEAIKDTLECTPPELSSDIIDRGIMLSGGGALLRGLDTLIQNETGIEVHIAESPLDCVALGAGAVLDNPDLAGRRKEEMSYL